jgi:hypothetical protein
MREEGGVTVEGVEGSGYKCLAAKMIRVSVGLCMEGRHFRLPEVSMGCNPWG